MSIKLGEQNIGKIMLVDRPVTKVYRGEELVWKRWRNTIKGLTSPNKTSQLRINGVGVDYTSDVEGQFSISFDYTITSVGSLLYQFPPRDYIEIDLRNADLSEVDNFASIANGNGSLERVYFNKKIELKKGNNFVGMFYGCRKLKEVDMSMFTLKGNPINNAFTQCVSLTDLKIGNIETTLNIQDSPLTLQSAIGILDALQEVSTPKTITFSAYTTSLINASNTALAKVYDAEQKGWTIVGEGMKDYVELEYIESTGTQLIDTGVQLHRTDVVNIEFIPTTIYGNMVYFGVRSSGTWQTSEDQFYLNYNSMQGVNLTLWDALYTGKIIEPYIIVGSIYNASVTKKGLNNTHNTYLGALNNIGSASAYANAKYLKFDVIRGGLKIIDLVPAKRMSDGAIGMIDKISGQWYGNSGTGTFIGGEPKQD